MTRRFSLTVALAATLGLSAASALADDAADIAAIKAGMVALDKAFDGGDADAIRSLMTPDHLAVVFVYKGPQTVDEQIASLKELQVETYDSIPPTISMLGPDAALATLEHSYRGTFDGNPLPERVFASEVWVRVDGKWLQKFYQETVIEEE